MGVHVWLHVSLILIQMAIKEKLTESKLIKEKNSKTIKTKWHKQEHSPKLPLT